MRVGVIGLMVIAAAATGMGGAKAAPGEDPYLWLEEVSSPKALSWVEAHNAKSTAVLEGDARYHGYYDQALSIAQAKDRVPAGEFIGGKIYNFWQDADHVRGIWRRATLASYASGNPEWETVLDLDALATAENANWVWKGAQCARPRETRCLLNLSDGGEDAVTVREFDLGTRTFVKGGFSLPKGKQRVAWENENSLLVAREWKPGQLTKSGYAYVIKRLKRGQPLSAAVELFRGSRDDVSTGAGVLRDAQNRTLPIIVQGTDFWRSKTFILGPKGVRRAALPERRRSSIWSMAE
jgi:prolyl oligopeptidase